VYYHGRLGGTQCAILDTPGVNASEYQKHGECTNLAIQNGDYDCLIFLINYEHIGTFDEIEHLSFIKHNVRKGVPIIFCVNKVDSRKSDDLPLVDKMRSVEDYLRQNGFKKAPLFFVSSRTAYLYRVRNTLNDEYDIDDLAYLSRKVKRGVNMVNLYDTIKPTYIGNREDSFEYQCGIGYVEDYILNLI
jgi:GTPase Era involved in 16S rRNA processing